MFPFHFDCSYETLYKCMFMLKHTLRVFYVLKSKRSPHFQYLFRVIANSALEMLELLLLPTKVLTLYICFFFSLDPY